MIKKSIILLFISVTVTFSLNTEPTVPVLYFDNLTSKEKYGLQKTDALGVIKLCEEQYPNSDYLSGMHQMINVMAQ